MAGSDSQGDVSILCFNATISPLGIIDLLVGAGDTYFHFSSLKCELYYR